MLETSNKISFLVTITTLINNANFLFFLICIPALVVLASYVPANASIGLAYVVSPHCLMNKWKDSGDELSLKM